MDKLKSQTLILACIVLISLFGAAMAILNTTRGPWGYSDPVAYLSTARSLAEGHGIGYYEADAEYTYFTIQPPFFSIVLSLPAMLNLDLVEAARWLNISLYAGILFLVGWIFLRFSRVPGMGILVSALLVAFPHLLVMSISAYTEPLFLLLFVAGGACLLAYLVHDQVIMLLAAAVLIGLTPVTRYVGIALVAAGTLTLWIFTPGKIWARTKKSALFLIVSALPVVLWFIWVYFSDAGTIGGRILEVNWGSLLLEFKDFRGIFLDTIWKWLPFQSSDTLLRYRTRWLLTGVGLAAIFILSMRAERRLRKEEQGQPQRTGLHIFAFFGIAFTLLLGVVLATYLFTFPTIDIDNRTLLPLYVSGALSFFGALALWQAAWFKGRLRLLQLLPWVLAVLCIAWYIPQVKERMEFYETGTGLTAFAWDDSRVIQAVRLLPPEQPVISNDWELLLLWTERPIHGFWNTFPTDSPVQVGRYGNNESDSSQVLFCEQGAALVIFTDFPAQYTQHIDTSAMEAIPDLFSGLTVFGTYDDGMIYLCP